ncbi:NAD(P)-dependent alcohol dehydrogenase [Cryobacterium glaciale]|uniref:NAD(P)-dependent alcohol dehydrogenase n=1 Tax=Cryobacterium glaciale TaxID=1259145 RepID=A0A4R8URP1_9MICO|nr:NAD(P)-dependent alcohol dehydrogenase [Cryobacterium glaciale]TFB69773.1 NAD(P)-dependent alcohol dehydrogenase [Cryobacterium glaciale]
MKITAAVARSLHAPLDFETLELDEVGNDEVRVRLVATGVCHTDALVRDGVLPNSLPVVLGHEGSGIVEAIGENVETVVVGDHVVLGFNSCGACPPCTNGHPAYCTDFAKLNFGGQRADGTTSLSAGDEPVGSHFFGQSSFATHANVAARSVVKVPSTVPLELLGPLGCGISTGAGTVLNVLKPEAGTSIVIFGTGAVGNSALLAAIVSGCSTIIMVDVVAKRLDLARSLGATHIINGLHEDAVARVHEITGSGARYAIDTTGNPLVFRQMIDVLAPQGKAALVGAAAPGTEALIDIGAFLVNSPTVTAVIEGDVVPQTFIPYLIDLYERGLFPFAELIKSYPFENINQAFADSEAGVTIKPVVVF